MTKTESLALYLGKHAPDNVAETILALAGAAAGIAAQIRNPQTMLDAAAGDTNADGDTQKQLDVLADSMIEDALRDTATSVYLSEERAAAVDLGAGDLMVACDPLDGSSNIGVNVSVGTIASVLPAAGGILQPGKAQLAACLFVYGPQTTLLLSVGAGTAAFRMDDAAVFHLIDAKVQIPPKATEFAVNASNQRHWPQPVTLFIDQCLAGSEGVCGRDFNMRWVASLVAEAWRIACRGGVFLYMDDARAGYEAGRLRLVYEAAPVAMLIEQAGGRAGNGMGSILDITPHDLHQRVPLAFGAAEDVDRLQAHYHAAC